MHGANLNAVVYTAIAGGYPIERSDVLCFRDEGVFKRPVMEAKRAKLLPHLFLPRGAVTIWTDANIWLTISPEEAIATYLGDADVALFRHPYRATVWQEFAALRIDQRFAIPFLRQQMTEQEQAYREAGLPDDAPLFECSFMIRRNNDRVARLMEFWWAQVCRWQWRDQVSFPFALWACGAGVTVKAIDGNVRAHEHFRYVSQY